MTNEGEEGRSRLLDEVCELCGYERKYAIKVLSGKRAIVGSRERGGSQAIYGEAELEAQSPDLEHVAHCSLLVTHLGSQ